MSARQKVQYQLGKIIPVSLMAHRFAELGFDYAKNATVEIDVGHPVLARRPKSVA